MSFVLVNKLLFRVVGIHMVEIRRQIRSLKKTSYKHGIESYEVLTAYCSTVEKQSFTDWPSIHDGTMTVQVFICRL